MKRASSYLALATLPLALGACELAPKETTQNGFRGTGMNLVKVAGAPLAEVPAPPYELPAPGGPLASETYQNVQVLGNISTDEFNYLMAAITQWIAPEEGCNYCHNPANLASDEVYTKVVARSMIQMTQNVNANWSSHVEQTGVTCWTCHRGNAIPQQVWSLPEPVNPSTIQGNRRGQNNPTAATAFSSLPEGSVARYLIGGTQAPEEIRVNGTSRHPSPEATKSVMESENTFALMVHMSDSLGVNCTFCHNAQAFNAWDISPQTRVNAWHGIRMVREVNGGYISPLAQVFPDNRLGPQGDPYKVSCATCHQGQSRPLNGVPMVADYPALQRTTVAPAAAAPAPAPPPAAPQISALLKPRTAL